MRIRRCVASAVLLVLLGAPACSNGGRKPTAGASPTAGEAAPKAGFRATAVQAVDAADRPQAAEKANQVAAQVVELMNAYYTIAFVEPDKWGNGTHPEIVNVFLPAVRNQVGAQLQGLALGDLAPKITSVEPQKQEVTVKVDVENDMSTPVISAVTAFEATAETRSKADGPVKIVHSLKVLVAPDGGALKIAGGTAELKADSGAQALAPVHRTVTVGGAR